MTEISEKTATHREALRLVLGRVRPQRGTRFIDEDGRRVLQARVLARAGAG